jgi:uncharacterized protein DUF4224
MADPFLSEQEIVRLTGYKYPACQARHLIQVGIRFTRNRFGRVIVARSAIDARSRVDDDAPFVLARVR